MTSEFHSILDNEIVALFFWCINLKTIIETDLYICSQWLEISRARSPRNNPYQDLMIHSRQRWAADQECNSRSDHMYKTNTICIKKWLPIDELRYWRSFEIKISRTFRDSHNVDMWSWQDSSCLLVKVRDYHQQRSSANPVFMMSNMHLVISYKEIILPIKFCLWEHEIWESWIKGRKTSVYATSQIWRLRGLQSSKRGKLSTYQWPCPKLLRTLTLFFITSESTQADQNMHTCIKWKQ